MKKLFKLIDFEIFLNYDTITTLKLAQIGLTALIEQAPAAPYLAICYSFYLINLN